MPSLSNKHVIFDVWSKFYVYLKNHYHWKPGQHDEEFEGGPASYMLANKHGLFIVYSDRLVEEITGYWALGSGSPFALGSLHRGPSNGKADLVYVENALRAAAAFDDATGGPFIYRSVRLGK